MYLLSLCAILLGCTIRL